MYGVILTEQEIPLVLAAMRRQDPTFDRIPDSQTVSAWLSRRAMDGVLSALVELRKAEVLRESL